MKTPLFIRSSSSSSSSSSSIRLKSRLYAAAILFPALFVVVVDNRKVINFGVLLANRTANKIEVDYLCTDLDMAAAEASLTIEDIDRKFGWASNKSVVQFNFTYYDTRCSDIYGPVAAMELYYRSTVHALFGPCCKYVLSPVARYAQVWNIPVITSGGQAKAFSNQDFRTLTRFAGPYYKLADVFVTHLIDAYNWTHITIICHEYFSNPNLGTSECANIIQDIMCILNKNACVMATSGDASPINSTTDGANSTNGGRRGGRAQEYFVNVELLDNAKLFQTWLSKSEEIWERIRNKSRIVVLCASPDSVRQIMIQAARKNFHNGEYVFFNIDLFSSAAKLERPWYRQDDTDEMNDLARSAYETLLTVTLRKPDSAEYRNFSEEVKRRAVNKKGVSAYGEDEEVNSFVGAFHDAVILYALALNETLAAGFNATNGTDITRRMWNRSFKGITGWVSIDENGDRNADYSLLDMNHTTGTFEVVANYYGNDKKYEEVPGKVIYWGPDRTGPPPDTPECGFDGLGCPLEKPFPEYGVVIIVLGVLLFGVTVTSLFVYRHYKLEAELAEVNWRVRWDDIMFGAQEKRKLERSSSRHSLARRGSINSYVSVDTIAVHLNNVGAKQVFTKTGSYKATLVAIKKINRTVNVTKPLLMQFKMMRDLQNDHIVRFIGVCIDPPNQCVLTEYCQKGSLQDVLENEQIKLDSMFKFSLIQDIVRGMAYIHSSDIRTHANLKSSNCVVDSRFVLKITDFGLHQLRGQDPQTLTEDYAFYRAKLWTAPELLRVSPEPIGGTQKGDVYSFAIICQEIICRNGPFWVEKRDIPPAEILKMVTKGQKPYFRPTLPDQDANEDGCGEELSNLIRRCWAEEPVDRPDFHSLKTIIKRINKDGDTGGNLLDNLLSRMEQYANNLESLVEERTADYLEQKKRAEDLLYMMLPRSVAVQLMHGDTVKAEKFESVTIYFSDICGFTSMSAESTPMQVVNLLNDLYTTFDSIIDLFDVYKVETIGDAYMVVSGLPVANGIVHAREIARMAICLLNAVKSFKIHHRPHDKLNLRIGIHSGPVCAGIVGMKMPRYCLFGDTVNTASRMESNGEPLKIHVSPFTKNLLDSFGTFVLDLRGPVNMKGKGEVVTWWLLGEINPDFPDLAPVTTPTTTSSPLAITTTTTTALPSPKAGGSMTSSSLNKPIENNCTSNNYILA